MNESMAVAGAVIFLLIALVSMWFTIRVAKIENTAVLTGLMVLPLVTYLVLSGRLGEFKGPGGLEAKFIFAVNQPLRFKTRSVETSLQPAQVTARGPIVELPNAVRDIDKSKPAILTVTLGKSYTREDWLAYVGGILDQAPIAYAALVDSDNRLVAYMSVADVKHVLNSYALGGELIRLIAQGTAEDVIRMPSVRTDFVPSSYPTIDVLRAMEEQHSASMIVVDENGRITGIVKREDVIAQIVLDLTATAEHGSRTGEKGPG